MHFADRWTKTTRRVAAVALLLYALVPSLCAITCGFTGRCEKPLARKSCCGAKSKSAKTSCCEWIQKRVDPPAVLKTTASPNLGLLIAVLPTSVSVPLVRIGLGQSPVTFLSRGPPDAPTRFHSSRAPPVV